MVYKHGRKIIKTNPEFVSGCELIHDKLDDKYYFTIPEKYDPISPSDENQVSLDEKTIIFDEGVRAFLSGYVPNKFTIEFGTNQASLISLLSKIDYLVSVISGVKNSELITKLWRKVKILYRKIRNKVRDMHWKICKFLTSNFDTVILPHFPVKEIAEAMRYNKESKRLLYLFSHYSFKQCLSFKAREHGLKYFSVGEVYTSKTCGNCGSMYKEKGKTYSCSFCGIVIDRDLNAARNILLKTVGSDMAI